MAVSRRSRLAPDELSLPGTVGIDLAADLRPIEGSECESRRCRNSDSAELDLLADRGENCRGQVNPVILSATHRSGEN
jgi:hypothetical protein